MTMFAKILFEGEVPSFETWTDNEAEIHFLRKLLLPYGAKEIRGPGSTIYFNLPAAGSESLSEQHPASTNPTKD